MYYSEIDDPNNTNLTPLSGIKWGLLLILIFGELSIALSFNATKENAESNVVKLLYAVLFTWFIVFAPNLCFYYYGTKTNGFYGKYSIYFNSIFENTIGYISVMNEANRIFTNFDLGNIPTSTSPQASQNIQIALQQVKVEIHKSLAILVERFNIFNMKEEWNKILPLYTAINNAIRSPSTIQDTYEDLLLVVKRKYMIGKCLWFLYNGIVCLIMTSLLVNI